MVKDMKKLLNKVLMKIQDSPLITINKFFLLVNLILIIFYFYDILPFCYLHGEFYKPLIISLLSFLLVRRMENILEIYSFIYCLDKDFFVNTEDGVRIFIGDSELFINQKEILKIALTNRIYECDSIINKKCQNLTIHEMLNNIMFLENSETYLIQYSDWANKYIWERRNYKKLFIFTKIKFFIRYF